MSQRDSLLRRSTRTRKEYVKRSAECPDALEIPGRNQIKAGCREVRQIACCQASAICSGDRRDHAVRRGHRASLPGGRPHDLTVGERGLFRQSEDTRREPATPVGQPRLQPHGSFVRSYLLYAEGNLGNRHRGERKLGIMPHEPGDDRFVRLLPQGSATTFVSRKIKDRHPYACAGSS